MVYVGTNQGCSLLFLGVVYGLYLRVVRKLSGMLYLLDGQESERLLFRKIRLSDFNSWLEFHKSPITSKHWICDRKDAETECRKWYEKQFYRYENDLGGMNALIEKKSNKLIGHCGLLVQTVDTISELEIGYSLLPDFWNQGFASEAAKKCKDFAFENCLSDSLISIISLTNMESKNVALKIGMSLDNTTFYDGNAVDIFRISKGQS